jgi:hypothetical protein
MTDPRDDFRPFWPQSIAPFGTMPPRPSPAPKLPWGFPRIDPALLALWNSSRIPVPPAQAPWFPPATPSVAQSAPTTGPLDSTNEWGATTQPSNEQRQPRSESRGLLYSFSHPDQSLPGADPLSGSRGILGSPLLPNNPWLGQPPYEAPGVKPRADSSRANLAPGDFVPANRATNDATLAALRMLLPHIANPDFWKSPAPPSLTPTAEGKLPPADYDPRYAGVVGDLTNLAIDFFPVAGPAKPLAELGAKAIPSALQSMTRTALPAGKFARAPRPEEPGLTAGLYHPPRKPPRPFSADYPSGAPSYAGRLLADMDGRPLVAKYVAGRQVVGGRDGGLTKDELWDLATNAMGAPPTVRSPQELDWTSGRYLESHDPKGDPVQPEIWMNSELKRQQEPLVLAHETGHMIHDLAAEMSLAPFRKLHAELARVYSTLNEGKEGLRPPKRPQDYGYPDDEAPYERIAEGFRAYLTDPNYFKEVAPKSAAAFRALVNSHPWLSKLIQLNSLGGLAVLGGAKGTPDDEPDR